MHECESQGPITITRFCIQRVCGRTKGKRRNALDSLLGTARLHNDIHIAKGKLFDDMTKPKLNGYIKLQGNITFPTFIWTAVKLLGAFAQVGSGFWFRDFQ